jgi:DNA mismatch repair protein MSH4
MSEELHFAFSDNADDDAHSIGSTARHIFGSRNCPRTGGAGSVTGGGSVRGESLMAIIDNKAGEVGMAVCNLNTFGISLTQYCDTQTFSKTLSQIFMRSGNGTTPTELLIPHTAVNGKLAQTIIRQLGDETTAVLTAVHRRFFNDVKGTRRLLDLMATTEALSDVTNKERYLCVAAAAALIHYVEVTHHCVLLSNTVRVRYCGLRQFVEIDRSTADALRLVPTARGGHVTSLTGGSSLVDAIDNTLTISGRRFLRANVLQPLRDPASLQLRHELVGYFLRDGSARANVRGLLHQLRDLDIERIVSVFSVQPKLRTLATVQNVIHELLRLSQVVVIAAGLRDVLAACVPFPSCPELLKMIHAALHSCHLESITQEIDVFIDEQVARRESAPQSGDAAAGAGYPGGRSKASSSGSGGVAHLVKLCFAVRPNISGLLDMLRRAYSDVVEKIFAHCEVLREEHHIPSLRVSHDTQRDFFLTMDARQSAEADPAVFIGKYSSGPKKVSCTTTELQCLCDAARNAVGEILRVQDGVIQSPLLAAIRQRVGKLQAVCDAVSLLDFVLSLVAFATTQQLTCMPLITDDSDSPALEFIESEMPQRAGTVSDATSAVPNSIVFSSRKPTIVLTGPNASGKSTYARQVGQLVVLAHIGSHLPAASASFRCCDRLIAMMHESDSSNVDLSTFQCEMRDLAYACSQATSQSVVIIDELGRGTSSCEGAGIAWAAAEWLSEIRCATLFTTHFSQLTELETESNAVANFHMVVVPPEQQGSGAAGSLRFTYKLQAGSCHVLRYGMLLAEHVGFCPKVLARCRDIEAAAERQRRNDHDEVEANHPEGEAQRELVFRLSDRNLKEALDTICKLLSNADVAGLLAFQSRLRQICIDTEATCS